jgi:hypothetical protein
MNMNQHRIVITIIGSMVWAFGLCAGLSKDCIEVESHYTGDGWFQYSFRTLDDPCVQVIHIDQLYPWFTNFMESATPAHWTNNFTYGGWDGISYDQSSPQPRINQITFSARSSSTYFRRASSGLFASVYIQLAPILGGDGEGGYVSLDCLLPCGPEEADGSSPDLVSRLEVVPSIKIQGLIVTNDCIYGLTFSWVDPSIVELQGSCDLSNWTPVARFNGDPPQTTWVTNVCLNSFGEFFRLLLVADRYFPSPQASTTLISGSQYSSKIPIAAEDIGNGEIKVGFASAPNAVYEVTYCERSGQTISVKQIQATNTYTRVIFPIGEPRSAAVFKIRQLVK